MLYTKVIFYYFKLWKIKFEYFNLGVNLINYYENSALSCNFILNYVFVVHLFKILFYFLNKLRLLKSDLQRKALLNFN